MKDFKSTSSRLARLFKKSRDQWKQRAIEQREKIRSLEVKVRDLSQSRDKWKQQAKILKQQIVQIKKEQECKQKDSYEESTAPKTRVGDCQLLPSVSGSAALLPPARHMYPTFVIQLAIRLYTHALSSLRGVHKTFELFGEFIDISSPSFDIIRQWILQVGMYELTREKQFRSDWIIIPDHTIELGQVKCLVTLGIPREKLELTGFALKHKDVEVLSIEIMTSSTGDKIHQKLSGLSVRIGVPLQIVSDHGPDLNKGIELFLQDNPDVVYTYDVTHKMASIFRHELEKDKRFSDFVGLCATTIKQIQQTELHFLAPPKQRIKSRYLNIDRYVQWANNVLSYQKQNDFSQISSIFSLDKQSIYDLKDTLDDETLSKISPLISEKYLNEALFSKEIIQCIGKERWNRFSNTILKTAGTGEKRFRQKLGWLAEYKEDINIYSQMVQLVHVVEKQVKDEGLSRESGQSFEEKTKQIIVSNDRVQNFKNQVIEYLAEEGDKIPENQTLLATSDIIESIFGKYKYLSAKNPLKEVGKMILAIPVFAGKIKDTDFVKKALETIRYDNVEKWAKEVFGQSTRSKRIKAFNPN